MVKPSKVVSSLGMLGIVLGLSAGAYGFTAANTVPVSKAGDGAGNISGYNVSAIHYVLDTTTPTNVDSITFMVDTAPIAGSTMMAKIGGNWYTCNNGGSGTTISCPTAAPSQLTVKKATTLEALIAD